MNKVYVVTQGEYSDYHICAVFDSRKLAQNFVDAFKKDVWSPMEIEEYTLNKYKNELSKGYKYYFVRMDKKGNVIECTLQCCYGGYLTKQGFDINNNMFLNCFAKDRKHAIKIANEKRTKLLALDRWRDDSIFYKKEDI